MNGPADYNTKLDPLQRLAALASAGNPENLASLRDELDRTPEFQQQTADLGERIKSSLILAIANSDPQAVTALDRQLAELKSKLASPSVTALEHLAIEQVLVCRLHFLHMESLVLKTPAFDVARSRFVQQQQENAHRRYESALKSLAEVQRMQRQAQAKPGKDRKVEPVVRPKIHQPESTAEYSFVEPP